MNIKYKTEGLLELPSVSVNVDKVIVKWVKGDDTITLLQGSSGKITLSKHQIIMLAYKAEVIADDISPNMGSLPRPA